jgi:shikimate kinase
VVYLEVGYEEAVRRVGGDTGRPMLARSDLPDLYRSRLPAYAGVATLIVATDDRHPEVISQDILTRLAAEPVPGGRAPSLRPAP